MSAPNKARVFHQHAFARRIELFVETPRVFVSRAAYNRMWHFVDLSDREVGWLGSVKPIGSDFLIEEVFLFKQKVSAASTEISPEGIAVTAQEIISGRPDGVEICNRLCFWGHSHVQMGTEPSLQDEEQMESFRDSELPFFIRGILNKRGRMEFTIFLYEKGMVIVDAEWSIYEPVDNAMRAEIAAELKAKVSEIKVRKRPYLGFYSGLGEFADDLAVGNLHGRARAEKGGKSVG